MWHPWENVATRCPLAKHPRGAFKGPSPSLQRGWYSWMWGLHTAPCTGSMPGCPHPPGVLSSVDLGGAGMTPSNEKLTATAPHATLANTQGCRRLPRFFQFLLLLLLAALEGVCVCGGGPSWQNSSSKACLLQPIPTMSLRLQY